MLHRHPRLPARGLRGAREKDADSASFYIKSAIANKQLVITKNIFFEFRVSKLMFLYKAATVSGAVLGRSKKKNKESQLYSLCSEDNSSLIFSYSSIKKNLIALNTKKCYFDRTVRHIPAESQKAMQRQKGIAYTKKIQGRYYSKHVAITMEIHP